MNTNSLVPLTAGTVQVNSPDDADAQERDERARCLFAQFRNTFAAQRALGRLVFWREISNNRSILRSVSSFDRKGKQDDTALGIVRHGIPAETVLVGNFAANRSMTRYRWEIYNDSGLKELWKAGRFDRTDLLGHLSESDIKQCGVQSLIPAQDWDFDNLALYHRCPKCGGVFDRESVIFLHQKKCETCGKEYTFSETVDIIQRLLRKELVALPILPVPGAPDIPIQKFLDPVANSVMYWWICRGQNLSMDGKSNPIIEPTGYKLMLHRSVFGLTMARTMRSAFELYVREIFPNDLPLLYYQLPRMGRYLANYPKSHKQDPDIGVAAELIRRTLPSFINSVILHQSFRPEAGRSYLLEAL